MKNPRIMIFRTIVFLVLNFAALIIGSILTENGVSSDWYQGLEKAPWSPPGWVFGAAWLTVMICFAFFMAFAWKQEKNHNRLVLGYALQWLLNVSWNPVFFYLQHVKAAFVIIIFLTLLTVFLFFLYKPKLRMKSAFILPYVIWMLIATSLNGYILFTN